MIKTPPKGMIITNEIHYIQTEEKEKKVHSRILEADGNQIRPEGLSKEKEQGQETVNCLIFNFQFSIFIEYLNVSIFN